MREPDDIKVGNAMDFYHKSLDLSSDIGIRNAWDQFFSTVYRPLEQVGIPFEKRVLEATLQANAHFEMRVDGGINENDYV